MRRSFIAVLFALIALGASATTVTGTVTDSDSVAWANGFVTFKLIGNGGPPFYCAGVAMTPDQTTVTAAMNGSGAFSTTLCANNTITPVNTQWSIQVFSAASATPQTITPTTISGSSQSLTTYINGLIKPIRIAAATQTRAYADGEILSPVGGTTYYNLTNSVIRLYNGAAWTSLATGSTGIGTITSTGSTISITNATGPSTNLELNLSHPNVWTGAQTLASGSSVSGTGSATNFNIFAFSGFSATLEFHADAGFAGINGIKFGSAAGGTAPYYTEIGANAQVFTDSLVSDAAVSSISRVLLGGIGDGTHASVRQVGVVSDSVTCVVLSGATPVIGNGPCYSLTLSTATTPTLTTPVAGQRTILHICQDATAGRTYTPPAGMHGAIIGATIGGMAASTCANQAFQEIGGGNLQAESTGVSGVTP